MGIDQLGFQSVQLGYLKILQMGNTDPNNTKAGKEYEDNPEYDNLNRASIPTQCINRGNHRSVIFRPVSHHSSVVFRHNQSIGHHFDDSVVPFRHDTSVGRSQHGSISAVRKSSTRTSALKFYLNRSYSGTEASTAQNCYLAGHVQHSRDFPGAQIQKIKRAEELSGLVSGKHSINTATSCSSPTSTQDT
ncbi:hypothetical protein F511_09664 [Dorcoceras hygrometricum]|uniref:Uncharacterized protein n=1 Tax=Dorcoceras hygrometricum TaxID=472368 RepID=A0A2Z7AFX6_9LAMI|nr:hypothetical protein F511_09664 [Dorcoceras hygrometricum]